MNPRRLLLVNVALAFYNLAVQWLLQLDVYPSWKFVPTADFGPAQSEHFLAVCIAIFPAAAAATVIATILVVKRPRALPPNPLRIALGLQAIAWLSTALVYGPWQGKLTEDLTRIDVAPRELGPANASLYHAFLMAHWGRVAVVTAYAGLAWWLARRLLLNGPRRD